MIKIPAKGESPPRVKCPVCNQHYAITNMTLHLRYKHPGSGYIYDKTTKKVILQTPNPENVTQPPPTTKVDPVIKETAPFVPDETIDLRPTEPEKKHMPSEKPDLKVRKTKPFVETPIKPKVVIDPENSTNDDTFDWCHL